MSVSMDSYCIQCILRRNAELVGPLGSAEKATAFTRALMDLILRTPADAPSPALGPGISDLLHDMYGIPLDRFREEKEQSNRFVLERLPAIRARADNTGDPILASLQFAVLGNYLDFSALQGQVDFGKLDEMLDSALEMELDENAYRAFRRDLETGKRLLYLTDNAGEIGFDRILAEEIQKAYPHLAITFCVRGDVIVNDATREDARAVGLPFPVIDTGNRVGGTDLNQLSEDARQALEDADVVLAKGMGNAETMLGCGYNVYYAFLIKCPRFIQRFEKPMLTPMFLRETGRA